MIKEEKLMDICDSHNINYKKLIKINPNILKYGNEIDILYILDFLKTKLNIESKNIEKCPSILYFGVDNIKANYRFLKEKEIREYDVETCLHILSSEPMELRRTYDYVEKEYGLKYLSKYTSILSVNVEKIKNIENEFPKFDKQQLLQAAMSGKSIQEIKNIVEVCRENNIEIPGTAFQTTAEERKSIVEVCRKN